MLTRLLRAQLKPYWSTLALVVGLQFIQSLAMLYLPTLNAEIIDDGVAQGDSSKILHIGGMMLGVTVVQVIASVIAVYFGSRTAMAVGRDIRSRLFARVQTFSTYEVTRFGTPSLITRTTNDVQQVQMLSVMAFTMLVAAPIMSVGAIIMALRQDVPLSGLLVLMVPVMGVFVAFMVTRLRPLFRAMQDRLDHVNQVLREQISGVRVVRAFVRDRQEKERFAEANDDLYDVSLKVAKLTALLFPTVMLAFNLTFVGIVWFGGHRIDSGAMEVGGLSAFLSYLMQNLMSVMVATFMLMMAPRAEVCAERIQEVLDTEPTIRPPTAPIALDGVRGSVELRDVEFRYPGAEQPVLCNINLVANPGETTAIVGSTGSGKSTLINLVPRLFDVTAGQVLVDGTDVCDLDPDVLARAVGLVPSGPTCSPAPWRRTCATAGRTPPTTSCGGPSRSPRPGRSSRPCPRGSTPPSPRAAPTCPAASASGSPSPGRWSTSRRCTCSTIRSRRSTTPPTRRSGLRWPARCATPRSSSSPSGSAPSAGPSASWSSTRAASSAPAPMTS